MTTPTVNFYDVLRERGLVAQTTDPDIRQRFEKTLTAYIGFDATADSLHVGSLVPIMGLAHLQRCGHRPIVLLGGATTLIGDPSGKSEARKMLQHQQIDANAQAIAAQIGRFVRFDDSLATSGGGAVMVNNADWLAKLNWIDLLRTYGPHFSVNRMLTMDSVKSRLDPSNESGLSFLEFNYMVMQAIDFLKLHQMCGCSVQLGGQDQWGNIVMGIELARRMANADLAGLTFPLVTKSDGGKFGKSEKGNIWLDPRKTSSYDFYQFWRNTADADVAKFLGWFTFVPMDEVRKLTGGQGAELNPAKQRLAYEITRLVHGQDEADKAMDSARKAFSASRDVTGDAIPHAPLPPEGGTIAQLLVAAGLASSNSDAKKLVQGGGVRLHDEKVSDPQQRVGPADARDGFVLLRAGKKRLFRFDVA
ncbi:MAG: tyrosine--tRNA ligase [Phycisphaeraceae bacterium]|nr:tyrosine--tRNA ligase [Phycisphaeraceae bacterium]